MMLRIIHFLCPVNTAIVGQLQNHCLTALSQGATELSTHISSQGGEIATGFTVHSFPKSLPVTVKTCNISNVESIVNIIFLVDSKRFTNPLSKFLSHPLLWDFVSPAADHTRLREYRKCFDNDLGRLAKMFNIDIGIHIRQASLAADSAILDADKAPERGIVNSMKTARLTSSQADWWVV